MNEPASSGGRGRESFILPSFIAAEFLARAKGKKVSNMQAQVYICVKSRTDVYIKCIYRGRCSLSVC